MYQDFNTPQRAQQQRGTTRSVVGSGQTPDHLSVLRDGSLAQSPAPRFPFSTSPSSAQKASPSQQQSQPRGGSSGHGGVDGRRRRAPRGGGQYDDGDDDAAWSRSAAGGGEVRGSQRSAAAAASSPGRGSVRPQRRQSPTGNSPDEERRRSQRDKQINFGYATGGYRNMERLIRHDPLLRSGGLLPLAPPTVLKGSKRLWDIQLRKWRRALHMFDYVFIEGEDEPSTKAAVIEEQRQQWVSEAFQGAPRDARKTISVDALRRVQHSPAVPTKIPVEEDLKVILRSEACYESVRSVVPQSASSLTKGTDISPLEAGIKIHIAPSTAVLQRQQAQHELQQRLTSLQQQQQQQAQQQPLEDDQVSAEAAPSATPQRGPHHRVELAASPPANALGGGARKLSSSPSPRRPSLATSPPPPPFASATAAPGVVCRPPPPFTSLPSTAAASGSAGVSLSPSAVRPASHSDSRRHSRPDSVTAVTGGAKAEAAAPVSAAPLPLHLAAPGPQSHVAAVPWAAPAGAPSLPPPPLPLPQQQQQQPGCLGGVYGLVPWYDSGAASLSNGQAAMAPAPLSAAPGVQWACPQPFFADLTTPVYPQLVLMADGTTGVAMVAHGVAPPPSSRGGQQSRNHASDVGCGARTPSAGRVGGESLRRGTAGSHGPAGGTPQTVPRFVARLSTSPSEKRLGEQQQQQHSSHGAHGDVAHTRLRPGAGGAAPVSGSQRREAEIAPTPGTADALEASAKTAEKSPSLADATPKRALFEASTAMTELKTEARQVQRRGDAGLKDDDEAEETLGKAPIHSDTARTVAAPLSFQEEEAV